MSDQLHVLRAGVVVDGFELTEQLGSGGFGVVYEGVSDDNVSVALKFSKENCIAFVNEAETLRQLNGTGLAPELFRVGQFQGLNYLCMEEATGSVLDIIHMTMQGELSSKVIQKVLYQTHSALEAIHEKGFLHQDMKAENLFLTAPDNRNTVRIIVGDWGMAVRQKNGQKITGDIDVRPGGSVWYSSASALLGNDYTVLDDILMLSYCSWCFQSLNIDDFSGENSVNFKISLLKDPFQNLPDALQWLLPYFAAIQEAINDEGIDYGKIREGIEDVLRDTNGTEEIRFVGGENILE